MINLLKKILLILFIFLCPLGAQASDVQDKAFINNAQIISPKHNEKDYIKNDAPPSFCLLRHNESTLHQQRRINSFGSNDENCILNFNQNIQNYIEIYSDNFLNTKPNTVICLLLNQIEPNAP